MKNSLKYSFLAALFFTVACGNAATEKEKVVRATTTATKPIVKETPKTVVIEKVTEDKMKKEIESTMTKKVEKATDKVVESKPVNKPKPIEKDPVKVTITEKAPKATIPAREETTKPIEKPDTESPVVAEVKIEPKKETPAVTKPKVASEKEIVEKTAPVAFSHDAWNTLAQKHISSTGKVNYKGFKADIAAFDAYLKSLADNPVQNSWSRGKKMAYWINAYNAFTIKLIVDNYPVKKITDLEGGKPWDKKWIKLGGKTYSLNNIEHDILRPQFKDARIHFAVNCAAQSCPPVWNKAWTEKNLNGQLERSTKAFVNNSKYNAVGGNEANISKIFEWYAVDFGDNIITYLNKYANTKVATGTAVKYKEYNWALNE